VNMPVCIGGMGRSGTSMTTKLLHLCGLYLGAEGDLLPADPANADGYWENRKFMVFNDALLSELGGAWDCPPLWPAGDNEEWLAPFKAKADELLSEFSASSFWGWKDPRNSLTLPFWQSIFPDLKVIVCLRNPLEVARSLERRQMFSYALSISLWTIYNQRVLNAVPPERRIIIHYDSYFHDPRKEIQRVSRFLGITVSEATLMRCRDAVAPRLRHHQSTTQDLRDANVALNVITLYEDLCAEAGLERESSTGLAATSITSARASESQSSRPQPSVAGAGVGRLDPSATTVMLSRKQLEELSAQAAECEVIIGEMQHAHEQRRAAEAFAAASASELVAARTEQQQLSDRIQVLEQELALAQMDQQLLQDETRDLQQQRTTMEIEWLRLTAWAHEMERRLGDIERNLWYRIGNRWHRSSR
jgi:hypothetical protein